MTSWFRRLTLIAAIALIPIAVQAADNVGTRGSIVSLSHNHSTSDKFLQYHGRMIVADSVGGYEEYRWGGVSCGSRVLTDAHLAELVAAMNNPRILIDPLWQPGQGNSQCVVGFTFLLRSQAGLL